MHWILFGAWQIWGFGKGWITPEALAVDSQGVVHMVYRSGEDQLIHAWFEGNAWPSETIGTCTSPPVLRVGTVDKGLHVIAGSALTYYYRSTGGSGWFKKSLGYNASDYDLFVQARPLLAFSTSGKVYRGSGDTLGNFSVTLLDSSYVHYYPPDPPYYYRYSYSVRGPASIHGAGIIWYSIFTDSYYYKKGSLVPNSCSYRYGDLEAEHQEYYYGYSPCTQRVDHIACEKDYLVYYNPKSECDYIRTYPMNDTIRGLFWAPDICYAGSHLLSAIGQDDRFPCLIRGTNYYPVDTVRSTSVTSIAATDTENVFIAYVGYDTILRVAHGAVPSDTEEPPPSPSDSLPPPIFGSIIPRDPSQSGGYIRFTTGADGFMDCDLYKADGTRAYHLARDVGRGEEIRIFVRDLGPGVYYLWIRIAWREKRLRVVIL